MGDIRSTDLVLRVGETAEVRKTLDEGRDGQDASTAVIRPPHTGYCGWRAGWVNQMMMLVMIGVLVCVDCHGHVGPRWVNQWSGRALEGKPGGY